jgi:hypothetical protein
VNFDKVLAQDEGCGGHAVEFTAKGTQLFRASGKNTLVMLNALAKNAVVW